MDGNALPLIRLWLDDIRPIPSDYTHWAKTAQEAIKIIDAGGVTHISLDHDLGDVGGQRELTGYDVATHIEEGAANGTIAPMTWDVHSANPSGASRIRVAMESAERFWMNKSAKKVIDTEDEDPDRPALPPSDTTITDGRFMVAPDGKFWDIKPYTSHENFCYEFVGSFEDALELGWVRLGVNVDEFSDDGRDSYFQAYSVGALSNPTVNDFAKIADGKIFVEFSGGAHVAGTGDFLLELTGNQLRDSGLDLGAYAVKVASERKEEPIVAEPEVKYEPEPPETPGGRLRDLDVFNHSSPWLLNKKADMDDVKISKTMSYILRHKPQAAGITLDDAGWTTMDELINGMATLGTNVTREDIERVVATNDKKRFTLEGDRIRAAQGHSIENVDLGLTPEKDVPEYLYHGTTPAALYNIRADGLRPMSRQYVHLSIDEATATTVGSRRGRPIVLRVRAREMANAGYPLFLSTNKVWLTEHVPAGFIDFGDTDRQASSDKRVIIMRGLPGSGKSTRAKEYGGTIVSADDFFMQEGEYRFDPNKLGAAHDTAKSNFEEALKRGDPVVVVDNTNTTSREYSDYVRMAEKYGYAVEFDVVGSGGASIEELTQRNTHGVPQTTIQKMVDRWEGDKLYPEANSNPWIKNASKLKPAVSAAELAKKWKVSEEVINKALDKGQKVELEHTKDKATARTIASHHIEEDLNYYDKLEVMEKKAALTPDKAQEIKEKVLSVAKKYGYRVYAVGGYVRDLMLGRPSKDIDLVALKDDEGIMSGINLGRHLMEEYGLPDTTAVEKPEFGTTKVIFGDDEVDIISPRKEKYDKDSRNPETQKGTLEDDARRRDFTVNALYQDIESGEITDPTGMGLEDIKNKVLRASDQTDPDVLFSEDPLRAMRGVRQAYSLGFTLDEGTKDALKRNVERLPIVAVERIRAEFEKILTGPQASSALNMLRDVGLLHYILPEMDEMFDSEGKEVTHGTSPWHEESIWKHTMNAVDLANADAADRWVALLHDIAKPRKAAPNKKGHTAFHGHDDEGAAMAEAILKRLNMSGDLIKKIVFRIKNHMRPHDYNDKWTDQAINKFMKQLGPEVDKVLEFARVDTLAMENRDQSVIDDALAREDELKRKIEEKREQGVEQVLLGKPILDGNELKSLFNKTPGPWIGEAQKYLSDLQVENPRLTKEEAIAKVKEFMGETNEEPQEGGTETQSSLKSECACGCSGGHNHCRSVIIGTVGFNYDGWKGEFYPKDIRESDKLLYLARHIPAVEINATTHIVPRRDVFERWAAQTPKEFIFSFRVVAGKNVGDTVGLICSRALQTIGLDRLGPISVVIPENYPYFKGDVFRMCHNMIPTLRYAFDIKSNNWINEDAFNEIKAVGGTIVRDHLLGGDIDSEWDYIRLPVYESLREANLGRQISVFASTDVMDPQKPGEMYVYVQNEDGFSSPNIVRDLMKVFKKKYKPSPIDLSQLPAKHYGPHDYATGPNNSALPSAGSDGGRIYGPMNQQEEEAVDVKERKLKKPGREELTPTTTFDFADGTTNTEGKVDSGY